MNLCSLLPGCCEPVVLFLPECWNPSFITAVIVLPCLLSLGFGLSAFLHPCVCFRFNLKNSLCAHTTHFCIALFCSWKLYLYSSRHPLVPATGGNRWYKLVTFPHCGEERGPSHLTWFVLKCCKLMYCGGFFLFFFYGNFVL